MRNILLTLSFAASTMLASAAVTGTWINHSAIDIDSQITRSTAANGAYNYINKMFESEDYIYILAHGKGYNTASAGMKTPVLLSSYIDKTSGKFEALSNKYLLSGSKVEDMTYSPVSKTLAIIYDNKKIDFINEVSGEIVTATGLATYSAPGGALPDRLELDLDGKTATVTTNFGFMSFDTTTGEIETICSLDEAVRIAVRMGDKYLGLKTSGFFTVPAKLSVTSSDLTDLSIGNTSGVINGLVPVSEDSFLILANPTNFTSMTLYGATLQEDNLKPTAQKIITESFSAANMALTSTMIVKHALEGLYWPTKNGIALSGGNNFITVNLQEYEPTFLTASDAAAFATNNCHLIPKDTSAPAAGHFGYERYQKATSFDGENFWILRPRHGLVRRHAIEDASGITRWETISDVIKPNMSAALTAHYVAYNPEFGVLARNQGTLYANNTYPYSIYLSDGLCSFKEGQWTRQSIYNKQFNITNNLPMMWSPRAVASDPLKPKYLYEVSPQHGLHRIDLTDPAYHLLLSSDKDVNRTKPGYVCITPSMVDPQCGFTIPGFDSKGTLWLGLTTWPSILGDDYTRTELWYWTAEDRLQVEQPADYAAHPMKKIKFDDVSTSSRGAMYPLSLPGHVNMVLYCPRFWDEAYILDHNGTLEDQTDDRITAFRNPIYANGDAFPSIFHANFAMEDPYDGKVLMSTNRGYVVFDPLQAFEEKQILEWLQPEESDDPSYCPHPLGEQNSWGAAIDNQGRKWIATIGEGLYCLSPDRKRVLAQFNEKNSPLSDNLYAITYNPERNSIMVGTEYGIMEFVPSGSEFESLSGAAPSPRVLPNSLHPDYQGHIVFSGISDGKYNIVNEANEVIDTVEAISGKADWHPAHLRHLLPAGTYRLQGVDNTDVIVL